MTWTISGPAPISEGDGSAKLLAWTGGATADGAALAVELPEWADNCVQIIGTIGGATIVIEGSNDGTNYNTLNAASSGALSFTALTDAMKQIIERPRWIRPKITGGAATGIGVYLLMRRANPLRT
jgi:zinc transporter ZupT